MVVSSAFLSFQANCGHDSNPNCFIDSAKDETACSVQAVTAAVPGMNMSCSAIFEPCLVINNTWCESVPMFIGKKMTVRMK